MSKSVDESDVRRYRNRCRGGKSRHCRSLRHHRSPSPEVRKRSNIVRGSKVLISVNERYRTAVNYRSKLLIHKYQLYDNDVDLEVQQMCKKVSVQTKDRAFNGKDPIYRINYLSGLKCACDAFRIRAEAAV